MTRIDLSQLKTEWKRVQHCVGLLATPQDYAAGVRYLRSGELPADKRSSASQQRYRRAMRFFELRDAEEIVYRSRFGPVNAYDTHGNQLYYLRLPIVYVVVHPNDKAALLKSIYTSPADGAFRSVDTLYKRVTAEFLGITRADVRAFLETQETYQLSKSTEVHVVKPLRPTAVMNHWEMDLVDVQQWAPSKNKGTRYLFVIIDIFSKFLFVFPLRDKEAGTTAAQLELLLLQEGAPRVISCDRGSEFVNERMDELSKRFEVEIRHSSPYHPESQGVVERANQTLKRMIKGYLSEYRTERYAEQLPQMVNSYNNAIHSTIRATPFQVHRGRDGKGVLLHALVRERIDQRADAMIERSARSSRLAHDELQVGQRVRLATLALAENRKLGVLSKKKLLRWTRELFVVAERRPLGSGKIAPEAAEDDDDDSAKVVFEYRLRHEATGDEFSDRGRKWWFRHQLQRVTTLDADSRASTIDEEEIETMMRESFGPPEEHTHDDDMESEAGAVDEALPEEEVDEVPPSPPRRERSRRGVPSSRFDDFFM